MPQVDVASGETVELVQGNDGDRYFIRTDGRVSYASNESFARLGPEIKPNSPGEIELERDGEKVFLHGQEAATVDFAKQGFSFRAFVRDIVGIDATESIGNVATEIADQTAAQLDVFDTTNYPNIGSVQNDSPSYPISIDETWTIKEFTVFELPSDKTIQYTAEGGDTATFEPRRTGFSETRVLIDSITISDPDSTGGAAHIFYAGE